MLLYLQDHMHETKHPLACHLNTMCWSEQVQDNELMLSRRAVDSDLFEKCESGARDLLSAAVTR